MSPFPGESPWSVAYSPALTTVKPTSGSAKSFLAKHAILIAVAGLVVFIALGICLFMMWCCKREPENKKSQNLDVEGFPMTLHKPTRNDTTFGATNQDGKGNSDSS